MRQARPGDICLRGSEHDAPRGAAAAPSGIAQIGELPNHADSAVIGHRDLTGGPLVGPERARYGGYAGVALPWSQGQVEGHVHRLRLVKQSIYGRARFALLRRRVLAAA